VQTRNLLTEENALVGGSSLPRGQTDSRRAEAATREDWDRKDVVGDTVAYVLGYD
jgi:hypothetical protein